MSVSYGPVSIQWTINLLSTPTVEEYYVVASPSCYYETTPRSSQQRVMQYSSPLTNDAKFSAIETDRLCATTTRIPLQAANYEGKVLIYQGGKSQTNVNSSAQTFSIIIP